MELVPRPGTFAQFVSSRCTQLQPPYPSFRTPPACCHSTTGTFQIGMIWRFTIG